MTATMKPFIITTLVSIILVTLTQITTAVRVPPFTFTNNPIDTRQSNYYDNNNNNNNDKDLYESTNKQPYAYCHASRFNQDPEHAYIKPADRPNAKLRLVHMFVRHGDRTATRLLVHDDATWDCHNLRELFHLSSETLNGDSLQNQVTFHNPARNNPFRANYWNGTCTLGQLTKRGSAQHVELGRAIRKVYKDDLNFLQLNGSSLHAKRGQEVFLRSTNIWRTKQSASSFVNGLYDTAVKPLFTSTVDQGQQKSRPESALRIHSLPVELETLGPNPWQCARLRWLLAQVHQSSQWKSYLADNADLKRRLDRILEIPEDNKEFSGTFDRYHDIFLARACHGKELPCRRESEDAGSFGRHHRGGKKECVTKEMVDRLEELGRREYEMQFSTSAQSEEIVQLSVGMVWKEVLDHYKQLIKLDNGHTTGSDDTEDSMYGSAAADGTKLFFYSAHDTTLAPIIGSLKPADKFIWPPYAANIVVELWSEESAQGKTDYFIRVFYNGKQFKSRVCDLEKGCSLDAFSEYLHRKVIPLADNMADNLGEVTMVHVAEEMAKQCSTINKVEIRGKYHMDALMDGYVGKWSGPPEKEWN